MLIIAFFQAHLLVGRKGATCCPRGGCVMDEEEMMTGLSRGREAGREGERRGKEGKREAGEGRKESKGGGKKESANPNVDL